MHDSHRITLAMGELNSCGAHVAVNDAGFGFEEIGPPRRSHDDFMGGPAYDPKWSVVNRRFDIAGYHRQVVEEHRSMAYT